MHFSPITFIKHFELFFTRKHGSEGGGKNKQEVILHDPYTKNQIKEHEYSTHYDTMGHIKTHTQKNIESLFDLKPGQRDNLEATHTQSVCALQHDVALNTPQSQEKIILTLV